MPIAKTVEFRCPKCRSSHFGSSQEADGSLKRYCHGCANFIWNQRDDWKYFVLIGEFLNPQDYIDYKYTGIGDGDGYIG